LRLAVDVFRQVHAGGVPRSQCVFGRDDATARRRHGKPFAELALEAQAALLQDVEKGAVEAADWKGVLPAAFFALLREHTMMGFYGDPRHGGNKDRVSWRMLGVPDPPIRGRLHETPRPPALAPRPPAALPSATRKG
jgi:gluconate 2-dehydrogenase gamma chain